MAKAAAKKPAGRATTARNAGRRVQEKSSAAVGAAQARAAGAAYEWHYGRVTRLGNFSIAGGREAVIVWEEGGVSSQQGNISEEQWEILKLAFMTSGRVALLSDEGGDNWMSDFRFIEAVR